MQPALQALDDVLTPHPVGPNTPHVIARRLRKRGLIVLDGLTSRTDVLALASGIMHITAHRDSDSDGLTTIRDTRRHMRRPGFAGFTNQELAPHTERSGIPLPPRLMFLVCGSPAGQGGECLLTDAQAVHTELVRYRREAAILLSEPRTAFFGAGDGHATQVFTTHPGGSMSVRLRMDGLARWSPMVQPHVRDLRTATIRNQLSLRLAAGQGYLLDNTRWLHARIEPEVLAHVQAHGIPVPRLLASVHQGGLAAMLLEDLGQQPAKDAPKEAGARAVVSVHACPPMDEVPVLDALALAALPIRSLDSLAALQDSGRWADADDVRIGLERIADVAATRAAGADIPPFGMCHSEFHPTSIHLGPQGLRILDWAKAFTGPGLLDLASWEDTPLPLNTEAINAMISAYITVGGPQTAQTDRGGLPAEVWAGGWHRVWIIEWYLQQCVRWIPDPTNDAPTQRTVRRHLAEALTCLT